MLPPPNQAPLPAGVQPTDPTSPRSMEGCYLQQVRGTLGTWPKAVSGRNSRTGHVSGWGTCAFRTGPAAQNGDGVDRVQASVDWDKQGPHPSSPTPQWGGGSQGRRSQRHIVTCIPGGPGILPHPCTVSACLFPAPVCLCSLQRIPETCSRTSALQPGLEHKMPWAQRVLLGPEHPTRLSFPKDPDSAAFTCTERLKTFPLNCKGRFFKSRHIQCWTILKNRRLSL